METKVCSRCGATLPIDQFYKVKYKNNETKYRYSVCKTCTSIEQRRRYLLQNDPENPLLARIEKLYEKHKAKGRSVPDTQRRSSTHIEEEVERMLATCD